MNLFLDYGFIYLISIIVALTIHEFSHAYASHLLGDDTAKEDGRLTLNPIKHLDLMGLISLFIIGFGWAKPVLVDPDNYKKPKRDMFLVSMAGPLSNIILFIIGIILTKVFFLNYSVSNFFWIFSIINLGSALFNLIPIPPLDGHRIWSFVLSEVDYELFSRNTTFGYLFILFIVYTGIYDKIFYFIVNGLMAFLF